MSNTLPGKCNLINVITFGQRQTCNIDQMTTISELARYIRFKRVICDLSIFITITDKLHFCDHVNKHSLYLKSTMEDA